MSQPSRREILKPIELLVMAAIAAVFTGVIVLMSTREPVIALVAFGVAFVVTLVVIAMFVLSIKPDDLERHEIDDEDGETPVSPH